MKIFLSTICIILLALFAYQVMSYPLANEAESGSKNKVNNDLVKSIEYKLPQLTVLKKIDQYSEIVERPLFDKSRKGRVTRSASKKISSTNELTHLILIGTARSSDVQVGIVADTKAKQIERLKVGEKYQDWDIAEVAKDYVLFQNAELEHKLFVPPIEGSQSSKQAKLISSLNKSKVDRAIAAIESYKDDRQDETEAIEKPKRKLAGRIWSSKKYSEQDHADEAEESAKQPKPKPRSPIKIPEEEEKDAEYYEGKTQDEPAEVVEKEISVEDFYDDEDITEDELKALEALGAKIFDD